jgi:hypothetical protein
MLQLATRCSIGGFRFLAVSAIQVITFHALRAPRGAGRARRRNRAPAAHRAAAAATIEAHQSMGRYTPKAFREAPMSVRMGVHGTGVQMIGGAFWYMARMHRNFPHSGCYPVALAINFAVQASGASVRRAPVWRGRDDSERGFAANENQPR